MSADRFLKPGTRVYYDGTGEKEFGIVIHCWMDQECEMYDCYVAFFGRQFPTDQPCEKPYVLRYGSTSLTVLDEER